MVPLRFKSRIFLFTNMGKSSVFQYTGKPYFPVNIVVNIAWPKRDNYVKEKAH